MSNNISTGEIKPKRHRRRRGEYFYDKIKYKSPVIPDFSNYAIDEERISKIIKEINILFPKLKLKIPLVIDKFLYIISNYEIIPYYDDSFIKELYFKFGKNCDIVDAIIHIQNSFEQKNSTKRKKMAGCFCAEGEKDILFVFTKMIKDEKYI